MPIIEIGVGIVALASVVVAYHVVPAITQLRKTLETTDKLVDESRQKLDGINTLIDDDIRTLVNNLNETVVEVNEIVKGIRSDVEKVEDVVEAVSEVGDTVREINGIVNTSIKGTVVEIASYIAGVKAIVETLYNAFGRFRHKEG
jgi:uncharacterized protein YoxC